MINSEVRKRSKSKHRTTTPRLMKESLKSDPESNRLLSCITGAPIDSILTFFLQLVIPYYPRFCESFREALPVHREQNTKWGTGQSKSKEHETSDSEELKKQAENIQIEKFE